ncbi:MurT ligase domain-containing protein [Amycolatopsis thermophila]|uniref:Lipid II isoglutaminyl synthase (glutamine-hydrolyzing) subunit MurT n=1 Tax=Amycolatopsis thermophila TaxID=206084 RepID=A0ABU0F657_9PSEU|nr:MurT ligase domain-containing protein [Amycolatopsis thermophila]MDQ0383066.1 UDP-N-acetylmuramyl tripeptide synthase [Amycolatopsis thermophila]
MPLGSPVLDERRARTAPERRLSPRTRVAVALARAAAGVSRRTGLGAGGVIGGRIAAALDPEVLRHLGRDRTVVLVTGTNGKTTTASMLTRVLEPLGPVAANSDGANMPDGVIAALVDRPDAPFAVLEVDENYVAEVAQRLRPACLVLLNLSRDQLDRVGEVRSVERALREAVSGLPGMAVVAGCDDPLAASAALASARPVWVSTGGSWTADALACGRCGRPIHHDGPAWRCRCGLARPRPDWVLAGDRAVDAAGRTVPLELRLPGRANAANATMAVAAAALLGVDPRAAGARLATISEVAGRYRRTTLGGHPVRVLLAKNPAGWRETLPLLEPGSPVVIAVNGREADGRDLSWLWDVPFEVLRGRPVVAAGERSADLAVRLTYADVPHVRCPDPVHAVAGLPPGSVELVANYTAFRQLGRRSGDG